MWLSLRALQHLTCMVDQQPTTQISLCSFSKASHIYVRQLHYLQFLNDKAFPIFPRTAWPASELPQSSFFPLACLNISWHSDSGPPRYHLPNPLLWPCQSFASSLLKHKTEVGLKNRDRPLKFSITYWVLHIHFQYTDSCQHLPCEVRHPTTDAKQGHIFFFPFFPSPAWLEITINLCKALSFWSSIPFLERMQPTQHNC